MTDRGCNGSKLLMRQTVGDNRFPQISKSVPLKGAVIKMLALLL